jgi:Ca2+-dependent lipid-binding protein
LNNTLKVIAMDWDRFTRNDLIGSAECNIEFCKKNPGKKQEFTIDLKPQGKIHFEVTVFSARKELNV